MRLRLSIIFFSVMCAESLCFVSARPVFAGIEVQIHKKKIPLAGGIGWGGGPFPIAYPLASPLELMCAFSKNFSSIFQNLTSPPSTEYLSQAPADKFLIGGPMKCEGVR